MERKLDPRQWLPTRPTVLADVHLLEALYGALTTGEVGLSARQLVRKMFHSRLWWSVAHKDSVIFIRRLQVVRGAGHLSLTLSKQPGQCGHLSLSFFISLSENKILISTPVDYLPQQPLNI